MGTSFCESDERIVGTAACGAVDDAGEIASYAAVTRWLGRSSAPVVGALTALCGFGAGGALGGAGALGGGALGALAAAAALAPSVGSVGAWAGAGIACAGGAIPGTGVCIPSLTGASVSVVSP